MIKIKELTVRFDDNTVLNNISIGFHLPGIFGIVGLNGSGKTTFFNALSNIVRPDSGEIYFGNRNFNQNDSGYLETVNFFYSGITGNEYLKIFKQTNSNFNLPALQEFTKLPLDELIETYSTGMKKKLALLAILKQDKPVYLFDEPFNGLDMETNKILELIILVLKDKGKTVFVSSHILDPLLIICDAIYFLENGNFTKSFYKPDFNRINDELFGKFKEQAGIIIKESV